MITREQVADLQPGDVVEFAGHPDLYGATLRGPLYEKPMSGLLLIAGYVIRDAGGEPGRYCRDKLTLTVVSRAPRPLYVNHPRTKPHVGDVIRDDDDDQHPVVWLFSSGDFVAPWYCGTGYFEREHLPKRLRLLVDGETGQVVTA